MTAGSNAVERRADKKSIGSTSSQGRPALERLIITTLAEYQSDFWLLVGAALARLGHRPAFIAFDDRSAALLEAAGFETTNAMDFLRASESGAPKSLEDVAGTLSAHGIRQQALMISHERFAFDLKDTGPMARRLEAYLQACARALDASAQRGETPILIQEFGGFLSVVAAYHAARARGIDNHFLEPSFFRGRLCVTRNSFATPPIAAPSGRMPPALVAYLEETLSRREIAVHTKDRHLLAGPLRRVLNLRNLRRLFEKSVDKYLLGKRQEFGHIGQHVRRHLTMLTRARRLAAVSTPLERCGRFVYYPLHVPADAALTLRAPAYLDQFATLDLLCRSVPLGWQVATKEHPAMVGLVEPARVAALSRRYDNFVLLPPGTNNFAVLERAEAVVTVNSKAGAEAMLLGRPTVVLAKPFYAESGLVHTVERPADLPRVLLEAIEGPDKADPAAARRFMQRAYDASLPGELYVDEPENVETVARSILAAVGLARETPAAAAG